LTVYASFVNQLANASKKDDDSDGKKKNHNSAKGQEIGRNANGFTAGGQAQMVPLPTMQPMGQPM